MKMKLILQVLICDKILYKMIYLRMENAKKSLRELNLLLIHSFIWILTSIK